MYARVQYVEKLPTRRIAGQDPNDVLDVVAGHPGFREGWMMRQLSGRGGVFVTLWDTREDAELAPERTAARIGKPRPFTLAFDEVCEVRQTEAGAAAGQDPRFAQVIWLNGPRSEEQAAADERSGAERIWPAVKQVPGVVRIISSVADDRAAAVLLLTTDVEAIDRAQQTAWSTTLLPGEDPALLQGPDRIDICAVVAGTRTTAPVG